MKKPLVKKKKRVNEGEGGVTHFCMGEKSLGGRKETKGREGMKKEGKIVK